MRLVRIDIKEGVHTIYEGKERQHSNQFTRVLYADELELFRTDHKAFLNGIEYVEEGEVSNG